jgi:hypothetical protein
MKRRKHCRGRAIDSHIHIQPIPLQPPRPLPDTLEIFIFARHQSTHNLPKKPVFGLCTQAASSSKNL